MRCVARIQSIRMSNLPALETANYTGVIGTIRFNPQVSPLFEAESVKESSRA
jgi:hypothetical protein